MLHLCQFIYDIVKFSFVDIICKYRLCEEDLNFRFLIKQFDDIFDKKEIHLTASLNI